MDRGQGKTLLQANWKEHALNVFRLFHGQAGHWTEWLMCKLYGCLTGGQMVPFLGLSFPIPQGASQGKAFGDCNSLFCPALSHPRLCGNSRPQMWGDAMIGNICWG